MIDRLNISIAGMKVGGKRRIRNPPALAYGDAGLQPTIPGNCELKYEVELKHIN